MKEFDLQRLRTARIYLGRMADGRNPATNQLVQNEVLDNPNVIRCLNFVAEVLQEVEENHGIVGYKKSANGKRTKYFTPEDLKSFQYRNDASIMQIIHQLREPFEGQRVRGLDAPKINRYLAEQGYIVRDVPAPGWQECWIPTAKGEAAGLYTVNREFDGKRYMMIMYSEKGQAFLLQQLEIMLKKRTGGSKMNGFSGDDTTAQSVQQEQQIQDGWMLLAQRILE